MITERTRLGIEILLAAIVVGLVGDQLLRAVPWGLNLTLCAVLFVGTVALFARRHRIQAGPDAPWLALTALLLAVAFVRRDAEALAQLDVLALLVTLALGAASLQGRRIGALRLADYFRAIVVGAGATVIGGPLLAGQEVRWEELRQEGRLSRARGVALGVLLAAPLLLVFGALFASADRAFNTLLSNAIGFDPDQLLSHVVLTLVFGGLAAGYLRWGLIARPAPAGPDGGGTRLSIGIAPVAIALGLLALLFLLFVVVQLHYFFGGADLVESTTGLTYAEYAREGFMQLVTASALTLPVILGASHAVRHESPRNLATFRVLAGVLLALLAVIMASAVQRLRLYVDAFGLTEDRLYAAGLLALLVGVFVWLAATTLRGRGDRFPFGALVQSYALLAALHMMNPDAFIVRTNLDRPVNARPFDAQYALLLGADAVPPLLEALPSLPAADRCAIARVLTARWHDSTAADWRSWNWSRARARTLVGEQARSLQRLDCPQEAKP